MTGIKFRAIGPIMNAVNEAGFQVTYAYDDLLFVEHSDVLIQFDDSVAQGFNLFFHKELPQERREQIKKRFNEVIKDTEMKIAFAGHFTMHDKPGSQEFNIVFNEKE